MRSAPEILNPLGEEIFDLESGIHEIETAQSFSGHGLTFSVTGTGASIDPEKGSLFISSSIPLSGEQVVVTATNSVGSVSSTLVVTIEDEGGNVSLRTLNHFAAYEDRVAFAGPKLVQLVLYDNKVELSDYREVNGAAGRKWMPDAHSRLGGEGSLDGKAGNFSGAANTSAHQLFFPWPVAKATEYTMAFSEIAGQAANLSAADFSENWKVEVAGQTKPIKRTYRKSVPIHTDQTAPWTYSNRRRHVVTLELEDAIPDGVEVRVSPPGCGPLSAIYDGTTISETIHVCQEGYPLSSSKKAYVGMWLGADHTGQASSTDTVLSGDTRWQLIKMANGEIVTSGQLSLAKGAQETHQSNLNYNGCDIYEADFSICSELGFYCLEIEGIGSSFAFPIVEQPYAEALRLAARWYYNQRSGCAIEGPYGEGRVRPRNDHPEDGIVIKQTNVLLGRHSEGFVGSSHIFDVLKAKNIFPALGQTPKVLEAKESELVPQSAFDDVALWRTIDPSFELTGSALEIVASPRYRNATLDLSGMTKDSRTYLLRMHVGQIEGTVRTKLNRGAAQDMLILAAGWNSFSINGVENASLFIDALANASATIDAIFLTAPSSTEDKTIGVVEAPDGDLLEAWGGWHDAGDWDRRVQHMSVVFTMAQMVELLPSIRGFDLNLPESGRTFADAAVQARKNDADKGDGKTILPDLIHEALWGISLWRRTQREDGGIIGGVEYSLDGIAGSVSWNHLQETYAYAPEEWSAYQFVTAASKLGHVIKTVCGDKILGQALISEAEKAWGWAEGILDTGIDSYNTFDNTGIATVRIAAAAALYRATGASDAREIFESYNSFLPVFETNLQKAGNSLGTQRGDYVMEAWEYVRAGEEGRTVNQSVSNGIATWSDKRFSSDTRLGEDYGLHSTGLYPWGAGWMRFGPGSNWRCARLALDLLAKGEISREATNAAVEGMWFGLGCNPSNVSLVQGLGARAFGDPLIVDAIDGPIPGNPSFGPAAGNLRYFEINSIGASMYPEAQSKWPRYAAIFESRRAVVCSEHGMKSNALEWLFACGFVAEALASQ